LIQTILDYDETDGGRRRAGRPRATYRKDATADIMTITITKNGHHRAIANVDGRTYHATFDPSVRRWRVQTDSGEQLTTSPKMHSIARVFQPAVVVNGQTRQAPRPRPAGAPRAPRTPRAPKAPKPAKGQAFATPKPKARDLMLVALAATEDWFAQALAEKGVTDDKRKAYERYQKIKALALGPASNVTTQNEADAALAKALTEAIKLAL